MLNAHTFPLWPYPGLAPELAVRSGMGGWEPYAQAAPADRLLPFVVTRTIAPGNSRWLNCARIEQADTGAVVVELLPVGYTEQGAGTLSLPFRKYVDVEAGVEHFVYFGGLITGLALPCGMPLRLVVENAYQSPRFNAVTDLSDFLLLEWHDAGPSNRIPYGTGFRQRFYVENGALQFQAPSEDRETTKITSTGEERLDYLALTNNATFTVPPVPAYLAEAIAAAQAVAFLEADGEPWQLVSVKEAVAGDDGGRWTMTGTVKQKQVLRYRSSCPAPALADSGYDAVADAPRPYRCGDATDTAPDWQTTSFECALNDSGQNTGQVTLTQTDQNPYSASTSQTRPVAGGLDYARCPLPVVYQSVAVTRVATKNDCPEGQTGTQIAFTIAAGAYTSTVNQAAADAQAVTAAEAGAQANANATGTCSSIPVASFVPVYEPDGCFSCLMANANDANDQRSATSEELDLYFRNTDNNGVSCVRCIA